MIGQILNRGVIADHLPKLGEELRAVAGGDLERPADAPEVSDAELLVAAELVEAATAQLPEAPVETDDVAVRRADVPPIDDYAYIPRDAVVSIVQSALEEGVRRLPDERVERVGTSDADDRRGGGLPPVTDEFIDGELPPTYDDDGQRRVGGPFEIPTDPGWVSCRIAQAIRWFRKKQKFVDRPGGKAIGNKARIVLVGDWGTGLPRAQAVSYEIRKVLLADDGWDRHVVHLGDVYYSGFDYEYRRRFLPNWPVRPEEAGTIGSWSLVGNHDMYAGGRGFWKVLLKDPRFAAHQGSSYFLLENEHWRIFGLDTGFAEEDGSLPGSQPRWLETELAKGGKRSLLLSHHQLFSIFGEPSRGLQDAVEPVLAEQPVDAWFWGHEHRCMTFSEHENVGYGCCLGHGGVPVYQWHGAGSPPAPGVYECRDLYDTGLLGLEPWAMFGFAVIDLDDRKACVRYVNEFGVTHWGPEPLPV